MEKYKDVSYNKYNGWRHFRLQVQRSQDGISFVLRTVDITNLEPHNFDPQILVNSIYGVRIT